MAAQLVCGMCIPIYGVIKVLVYGVLWDSHQKSLTWTSENPESPQKQGMYFNSVWCSFLETAMQLLNGYTGCGVLEANITADSKLCDYVQ